MDKTNLSARTTLRLDTNIYEQLRQEAYQRHCSISAVVRCHLQQLMQANVITAVSASHVPTGKTPEKRIENHIKADIDANGWFEAKYFGNAMGKRGVPDILACIAGKFVAIEVKAPQHGKPTVLQLIKLQQIADAGGIAILSNDKHVITNTVVPYLNKQPLPSNCMIKTYHQENDITGFWDSTGTHTVIFVRKE